MTKINVVFCWNRDWEIISKFMAFEETENESLVKETNLGAVVKICKTYEDAQLLANQLNEILENNK